MATKLSCILDTCPVTNKPVDMRRCCGNGSHYSDKTVRVLRSKTTPKPPCHYYGAKIWSEFGKVTCTHTCAKQSDRETRKIQSECFQAMGETAHLTMVGNLTD